nr:MAG TPA: hypothetical protein [Microviridae sp.]
MRKIFSQKNRKAPNKKQTCRKNRKNSTQFAKTKSVQNVLAG